MKLRRSTLIVTAVAIVGVLAARLTWLREQSASSTVTMGGVLLAAGTVPLDELDRVVVRRGVDEMVFERSETGWRQTRPLEHPVDPFSIRQLAVLAGEATVVRSIDGQPGSYGLDPPRAVIAMSWSGGSQTLQFGAEAVAGRWYVRRGGEATTLLCSGELYQRAVEMDPREWRDRRLFPGVGIDAERVEIVEGSRTTVLERAERRWTIEAPVKTRLDRARRDQLFQVLGNARSGGFIKDMPEDLADFGLDPPAGSFTIRTQRRFERDGRIVAEPTIHRLLVGTAMGIASRDRFGMVEGQLTVVRLSENLLDILFQPAEDLADPTATWVERPEVQSIVIHGETEVGLSRTLQEWTLEGTDTVVSGQVVDELIRKLSTARAERVVFQAYPRENEVALITLRDLNGRPLDTVRVLRDPGDGRLALENGDDVLRIMPEDFTLPLDAEAFRVADAAPGNAG